MVQTQTAVKLVFVDTNIGYLRLHEFARRASGESGRHMLLPSVANRAPEQAAEAYFRALSAYYAQFVVVHWRKRLELFRDLLRIISERQTFQGLVGPFVSGLITAAGVVGRREAREALELWSAFSPRSGSDGEVWVCDGDTKTMFFLAPERVFRLVDELRTHHEIERAADAARRRQLEKLIARAGAQLPGELGIEGMGKPGIGGLGGPGLGGIDIGGPFGLGDPLAGVGEAIGGLLGGRRRSGGPIWSAEGLIGSRSGKGGSERPRRPGDPLVQGPDFSGAPSDGYQQTPKPVAAGVEGGGPGVGERMREPAGPRMAGGISEWWNSRSPQEKHDLVQTSVQGAFQFAGVAIGAGLGVLVGVSIAGGGTVASGGEAAPQAIAAGASAGVATAGAIITAATHVGQTAGKLVAQITMPVSALTPSAPAAPSTPATPGAPAVPGPKPMQAPDGDDGLGVTLTLNPEILENKIRGVVGKRGPHVHPLFDLPELGPDGAATQLGGLRGEEAFIRLIASRGPQVNSGWDYGDRQVIGDIPRELLYEKVRQLIDPTPG